MSWNDPNLERRASDQNPDYFDRQAAQHELRRREEHNVSMMEYHRQQSMYPENNTEPAFLNKITGYLFLLAFAAMVFNVLRDPSQGDFASTITQTGASALGVWLAMTVLSTVWVFMCLTSLNRGREPFFKKIFKRFIFCLVVGVVAATLMTIRLLLYFG